MKKYNSKGDVAWYLPNRKRPIAYSTIAVSNFITVLAKEGGTVNDLINRVGWDFDAKNILQLYSQHGFGDANAADLFGEPRFYRTKDGRYTDGHHIFKSEFA